MIQYYYDTTTTSGLTLIITLILGAASLENSTAQHGKRWKLIVPRWSRQMAYHDRVGVAELRSAIARRHRMGKNESAFPDGKACCSFVPYACSTSGTLVYRLTKPSVAYCMYYHNKENLMLWPYGLEKAGQRTVLRRPRYAWACILYSYIVYIRGR